MDALHLFEWADRVLAIDAVQAGGARGAIYVLDAREAKPTPATASLHQLDLLSALLLAKKQREEVVILGIEPHTIGYGMDLSPPVRGALPQLAEAAEAIIARWSK